MILLDCGNSRFKAQFWSQGLLLASCASDYVPDWTRRLSDWLARHGADYVTYCSVLDAERQAKLDACLESLYGASVRRCVPEASTLGVVNAYREPQRLGADRWMALLAADEICAGDSIVIDSGSALTLDLLQADGKHLGGAILPGFHTGAHRFHQIFAHIDFEHPELAQTEVPGCSTESAIQIDYDRSLSEKLPALVTRWRESYLPEATLILCGGDAERVRQLLGLPARLVPDLVLRGLKRVALA